MSPFLLFIFFLFQFLMFKQKRKSVCFKKKILLLGTRGLEAGGNECMSKVEIQCFSLFHIFFYNFYVTRAL
ncbi:hypothetical protein L228DRAFT_25685 [Xylona heveae TC161]|uniref:Uncharacterized protein n=1 Tax=Xylona heveae (strain CBS 132557 / TC161) TaxID=1328760 RepID=A0A165ADK4_XYLHT|nr:hypothetical protein L228DRAFT_25685 [Xylona heveae TC161]KZF20302.1 hypothetical protein L228DRAFT_25685 [Xylona heveae TC161]